MQPAEDDYHLCNENETKDMVNSPKHYTDGQFEVIDVIKDWLTEEEFRGYIKGNTIKYVSRERLKNGDEDLFKTLFYLNYLMNGVKSDGRKSKALKYYKVFTVADGYHVSPAEELEMSQFYIELGEGLQKFKLWRNY